MWLMASKGRPQAAKQVLDECWQTGMRQQAALYVDGDPRGYDFKRPDNWSIHYGNGNLYGAYQWAFTSYPGERVYGWMADDNHPVTPGWSDIIEECAYPWHLVHCRDNWVSEFEAHPDQLPRTRNLGGGICFGGELLRSMGFWAPPGVVQAGIDWFWTSMFVDTGIGVYLPDVIVTHDNYRTGRREKDSTDTWGAWVQKDIDFMDAYLKTAAFQKLRERVLNEYRRSTTA